MPVHPRNHKPPAGSRPGAQTTKATYLSLPFALAGAARVLIGGPLGGLWEEHTDITQLCYSLPGQAAVGGWRGQEAGKGLGTACRVRVPFATPMWTWRTAKSPYPETFMEWTSPQPHALPTRLGQGRLGNSFLMLHPPLRSSVLALPVSQRARSGQGGPSGPPSPEWESGNVPP